MASRLVLEHKTPYQDFLYTQAPLLPYAYGLWMKLFGISWFSARSFSAMLTTILGLLVYEHVCRETEKWTAGALAVIVFASSTLIFAWFPIVKTYSLTGATSFRCLCDSLSAHAGIFTMAGRGCRTCYMG